MRLQLFERKRKPITFFGAPLFLMSLLIFSGEVRSQLEIVSDSLSVENLVNEVILSGNLQATNIEYSGGSEQFGLMIQGQEQFGLSSAAVFSTNVTSVGCSENESNEILSPPLDPLFCPDIWGLISDLTPDSLLANQNVFDGLIVEFDVMPASDSLDFRFVFATNEEVPGFDLLRFDAFMLLVSGPGISGPYENNAINLATLPSGDAISTNALDLLAMSNAPFWSEFCFDFYTTPMEVSAEVTCGESYHVKIVLAEAGDPTVNSAILFDAGTFDSDDIISIEWLMDWQTVDSPILYEGCGIGQLVFNRPLNAGPGLLELDLTYSTGAPGLADLSDVYGFPNQLIFPAGIDQVIWSDIQALLDANPEGEESLIIEIIQSNVCVSGTTSSFFTITISDSPDPLQVSGSSVNICAGDSVTLNADVEGGAGNYQYQWCDGSTDSSYEWNPLASEICTLIVSDTCGVADVYAEYEVVVFEAPELFAGVDELLCVGDFTLQGQILGLPSPACGLQSGDFNFCYSDLTEHSETYCPDNPGDGTFMELTFNSGDFSFGDEVKVFDGEDENATELTSSTSFSPNFAGGVYVVDGVNFQATNPNGCITILFSSDNSTNSCASGENAPIDYSVTCNNSAGWDIEWSPADGLTDASVLQPNVFLDESLALELSVVMVAAPFCSNADSLFIAPSFDVLASSSNPTCFDPDGVIAIEVIPVAEEGPWNVSLTSSTGIIFSELSSDLSYSFEGLFADSYELLVSDPHCTWGESIELLAQPEVTITLESDTIICQGGEALLEATPSYNDPNLEWVWSNGFAGVSQVVSPTSASSFSVYATVFPGCNTDTWDVTVDVLDSLEFDISDEQMLCLGDSVLLLASNLSGGLEPYTLLWEANSSLENLLNDTLMQWVSPPLPTEYCITLADVCESPDVSYCVDVFVPEDETAEFETDFVSGCFPFSVEFTGLANNVADILSEEWLFGDGISSSDIQFVSHAYLEVGSYDVAHTVTTVNGCMFSSVAENLIRVNPWPFAEFAASPWEQTLPNRRVEFLNYSLGANSYEWRIDNMEVSNAFGPEYYFPDDTGGEYDVTLIATNEWGCSDSISHPLRIIDDFVMYVPNVFTPDNDGVNDAWHVVGRDVNPSDFSVMIYNRWGELVYESTEIEDVWLGEDQGGAHYVANGVYFYEIIAVSLSTAVRHNLQGHINLLR